MYSVESFWPVCDLFLVTNQPVVITEYQLIFWPKLCAILFHYALCQSLPSQPLFILWQVRERQCYKIIKIVHYTLMQNISLIHLLIRIIIGVGIVLLNAVNISFLQVFVLTLLSSSYSLWRFFWRHSLLVVWLSLSAHAYGRSP